MRTYRETRGFPRASAHHHPTKPGGSERAAQAKTGDLSVIYFQGLAAPRWMSLTLEKDPASHPGVCTTAGPLNERLLFPSLIPLAKGQ